MGTAVVTHPTPREQGMAMPAEWAPHELTLMAWPARLELWGDALGPAKREYAAVARAISGFERVLMVAAPGAGREVRNACGDAVRVLELPIDDSWIARQRSSDRDRTRRQAGRGRLQVQRLGREVRSLRS